MKNMNMNTSVDSYSAYSNESGSGRSSIGNNNGNGNGHGGYVSSNSSVSTYASSRASVNSNTPNSSPGTHISIGKGGSAYGGYGGLKNGGVVLKTTNANAARPFSLTGEGHSTFGHRS